MYPDENPPTVDSLQDEIRKLKESVEELQQMVTVAGIPPHESHAAKDPAAPREPRTE